MRGPKPRPTEFWPATSIIGRPRHAPGAAGLRSSSPWLDLAEPTRRGVSPGACLGIETGRPRLMPAHGGVRWPTFFLAGVPRAGTTALFHCLRQHPQIFMSPIKEPTFFAGADLLAGPTRDWVRRLIETTRPELEAFLAGPMRDTRILLLVVNREDYLRLFRDAGEALAIGEASVAYFWLPSAAQAIAAEIPGARLIFILRDPADRLFSQHLASSRDDPGQSFRSRFRAAQDPAHRWAGWLEGGRYGTHLQRFFAAFPRDQIRVHLYEDFRASPHAVLRDIFGFLGVDPDHPIDAIGRHNEPAVPRFALAHRIQRLLFGRTALSRRIPRPVRGALEALYFRRRSDLRMAPADRQLVVQYFRDEVERAAQLIGRDLSSWLR